MITNRFVFAFVLAACLPAQLGAAKRLTGEALEKHFAPFVMPESDTKKLSDEVFASKKLCDTLFGPIEYKHLRKTKEILANNGNLKLEDYGRKVVSHPRLPNLIIKCGRERNDREKYDNISRVPEAKKMRDWLRDHSIEDIVVPHKWLYHLPGHPEDFCDGNYLVFAERLPLLKGKENTRLLHDLPFERESVLLDYLIEMRYPDMSDHNIFFLEDKQTIAIVDTEEWHWARDPNWCAKRFMTVVDPETVRSILDDEFCAKHKLRAFNVLYQELKDRK